MVVVGLAGFTGYAAMRAADRVAAGRHERPGTIAVASCALVTYNPRGPDPYDCVGRFTSADGRLTVPAVRFTHLGPLRPGERVAGTLSGPDDRAATVGGRRAVAWWLLLAGGAVLALVAVLVWARRQVRSAGRPAGRAQGPPDPPAARGLDADLVLLWCQRICWLPGASAADLTAALGLPSPAGAAAGGELAPPPPPPPPPPPGAGALTVVNHPAGFAYLTAQLPDDGLTRGDLDARLGPGRPLPRVHSGGPHVLGYSVGAPAAPWVCSVFASFAAEPTAAAAATELTIRPDAAGPAQAPAR